MTRLCLRLVTLVAILVPACGGGGSNTPDAGFGDDTVDPVLVPGGGVTGAAIAGKLNVFVIAAETGDPLAGVQVQIGDSLTGNTNTEGLVTFDDAGLTGAQTVTATAAGRVASTWIGVIGSSATLPLELVATPSAQVTGTIAGWDSLPGPALGNYNLGVVLYSFTDDVGAPENHLAQPMNGTTPANTCIKSALSSSCAWQMNARTGRQIHFAVIVEGDPHGTNNDPSDDTYTLKGYAIGTSMTLTSGQQVANESLTVVADNLRAPMTVGFPAAPGGLGDVLAIPMLDLGGDGRIAFPLPSITPAAATLQVLNPTGQFAGTYDLVGLATPPGAAAVPYSTGFARGAAVNATAQLPAWFAPPTQVTAASGTFSFSGADGAQLRNATFSRGTTRLWTVSLLDQSSSFTLPAVPSNPLGTGTATLEITAADLAEFDAGHFAVPSLAAALRRASGAQTTFTP